MSVSTSQSISIGPTLGEALLHRIKTGSPALWQTTLAMVVLGVVSFALQYGDTRLINGVGTWVKPTKFFFSLAVQFATVSWAMSYFPGVAETARGIRIAVWTMIVCGWLEMSYVCLRAFQAEGSHFNMTTPFAAAMYSAMGVAAVLLTGTAFYVGAKLWRHRSQGIWTKAASLGLIFGALLGTLAGAYLSAQTGHGVGGDPSDASGLGVFGWSTTGGDLRIAHFVGLHASQFIPLAAWTGRSAFVWLAVALCTVVTAGTFWLALMGQPLLQQALV
jgi:predicted small integral membrane protein